MVSSLLVVVALGLQPGCGERLAAGPENAATGTGNAATGTEHPARSTANPDTGVPGAGEMPVAPPWFGHYHVEIVDVWPHDPKAFTQGLEWFDGLLLESTGVRGRSGRRLVQPETGEVLSEVPLSDDLFGEGITVADGELIQLTWKAGTAIVGDPADLTERRRFSYSGQGWGLCHDGDRLIMSDGSATLRFRDPATFEILGETDVTMGGWPVSNLNELECIGDQVLANVWKSDTILVVDPASGMAVGSIDASTLRPAGLSIDEHALNGIAVHEPSGDLLLTGKLWPTLYRVRLVPAR